MPRMLGLNNSNTMSTKCTKRKQFARILGITGFVLIILTNVLVFQSAQHTVVLTKLFHSKYIPYVNNYNFLTIFGEKEQLLRRQSVPTPDVNNSETIPVRQVKRGLVFQRIQREIADINNVPEMEIKAKTTESKQGYRNVHHAYAEKSAYKQKNVRKDTNAMTLDKQNEEKEKHFEKFNKVSSTNFAVFNNCTTRNTGVEDILCMKPPTFLPNFRNPCWYHSSSLQCLLYFHIIGVCKTGTTDLFERLTHHPQILKNKGLLGKETWFWTWKRYGHSHFHRKKTAGMRMSDFINMFRAREIEQITRTGEDGTAFHPTITGHGDPMDFWDQTSWRHIPQNDPSMLIPKITTASLVHHINPNVKLILMLRDPVERLFSHYLHGKFGKTAVQFHHDVMRTISVLQPCAQKLSMKACLYSLDLHNYLRVPISGSFYYIHLLEWLKVFPRKQIYITRTEDLSTDVPGTLRGLFKFLNIDALSTDRLQQIGNLPHMHGTKGKTTAGNILNETRTILENLFQPHNKELANLLNDKKYLWQKDT